MNQLLMSFEEDVSVPRKAAIEWMKRNWHVYQMFVRYAKEAARKQRKCGINMIRERVRWECFYEWDTEDYKFSNSHSPYVARKLLYDFPEFRPYITCILTQDERVDGEISYAGMNFTGGDQ